MTKKVSDWKKKDHQTFEDMIANCPQLVVQGQEAVSAETLRLNEAECPFDQRRIISACMSCGFIEVNCWHADALIRLTFGLEELSLALRHVLDGARYTAVDIQRNELVGPQPIILLDWSTTDFPNDTVPAFEALRHFHVVGKYYGPYKTIQDYLEDTGLNRFVVYEWSREDCAWVPERSIGKVI